MLRQLETVYAVFALLVMTGGAVTLLTPTSTLLAYGSTGSLYVRILALGIGLSAATLFVLHRGAVHNLFTRYWPVLIPPLFAILSVFWAADFSLAFRRSVALFLFTLLGIWLAERFTPRGLFNCVLTAMLLLCLASLLAIVLAPGWGIHTAANGTNMEHVGSWRGVLAHKNDLGRLAAYTGMLFVLAGVMRPRYRAFYLSSAAIAMVLVIGSRSGQGIVLLVLPLVAILALLWLRTLSPKHRALALVLLVPFSVVFTMISGAIAAVILEALGKDPTLTGRTEIWDAVWQALSGNFLFGGGYGSGWEFVSYKVRIYLSSPDTTLSHAHNGYLDLMTDIGLIGVTITLLIYLWALAKLFRMFMVGRETEFAAFGFVTIVFCLAGNWVASFLLPHDKVFWVLVTAIFCKIMQLSEQKTMRRRIEPVSPAAPGHEAEAASLPIGFVQNPTVDR